MDVDRARRIRRRAFWIGFCSAFDLSGRRTEQDWRQLATDIREALGEPTPPVEVTYVPNIDVPSLSRMVVSTYSPPPGTTYMTWG